MVADTTVAITAVTLAAVSISPRRACHITIITGDGITTGNATRCGIARRGMSIPGVGETIIIGGSAAISGETERLAWAAGGDTRSFPGVRRLC